MRFQVLFHSPSWSAFHLSLTGTSSLSVTREYLALEGGPPSFPQDFTCPVVLGNAAQEADCHFAYRTITFCGRTFQNSSAMVGYTLTWPQKLTRRLIMQKARRHPDESGLRPLVSVRFQVLFTSLVGELFIIQSPYWFAIGRQGVFSLGGWTPQLHAEFHELDATLEHLGPKQSLLQDYHLLRFAFHRRFTTFVSVPCWCPQPRPEGRFGLFRFRSPLLTESRFLSFPAGT